VKKKKCPEYSDKITPFEIAYIKREKLHRLKSESRWLKAYADPDP
jgi:hypothetical protein